MDWFVHVVPRLAAWSYLVNTLNFRNIGDSVSSVFIIVGFDLSLENKKTKEGLKMLHFATLSRII